MRPAAQRPALSPGSEGRDMPAVATCPAATPTAAPAPPAAAAAPSPEALGTCGPRPHGGALAPRPARRGALPVRAAGTSVPEGDSERGIGEGRSEQGGSGGPEPSSGSGGSRGSSVRCSTALRVAAAGGSPARSEPGSADVRLNALWSAPKGGGDAASPCLAVCVSAAGGCGRGWG